MILKNKLNITDAVELARVEEKLSKAKANQLFTSGFSSFPRSCVGMYTALNNK